MYSYVFTSLCLIASQAPDAGSAHLKNQEKASIVLTQGTAETTKPDSIDQWKQDFELFQADEMELGKEIRNSQNLSNDEAQEFVNEAADLEEEAKELGARLDALKETNPKATESLEKEFGPYREPLVDDAVKTLTDKGYDVEDPRESNDEESNNEDEDYDASSDDDSNEDEDDDTSDETEENGDENKPGILDEAAESSDADDEGSGDYSHSSNSAEVSSSKTQLLKKLK